jgi:hypothetical protein
MKKIIAAFLFLVSNFIFGQNAVLKTDMPSAFCQAGVACLDSNIWVPLTVENPYTHQFYSTIEKYTWQGQRIDSIHISNPSHNYYSVHAVLESGNSLFVSGVKSSCGSPDEYFIGSVNTITKVYQEIKSYTAPSNHEIIKGMFNAGLSRQGFYTNNDVFISEFVNDTLYHVLSNLGSVAGVKYFNENIIVGSSLGLLRINPAQIYSPDTIISDMVRELAFDYDQKQIYTASNFYLIRVNHTWQMQDTMYLASSLLNLGAPQEMDAGNNKLYLLDDDIIYTTDSNFNFVANNFTIGLKTGDTHIKNFKVRNNRLSIFGVKGHFYNAKSSSPWFLGNYPLSPSLPIDLSAKLNSCQIDTLMKVHSNGEDFLKAKFSFSLSNTSPAIIIQKFTSRFYINGTLCSGLNSQQHFNNQHLQANSKNTFSTDWLSFGPVDDIHQYNSNNTRFSVFVSAINKTDYSSTLDLNVATPLYGYINISEDTFTVSISPNPFQRKLKIEGDFTSDVNAALYNANGHEVWSGKLKKKKTTVLLPELESGIYFIRVNNGSDSFTQKLVKL